MRNANSMTNKSIEVRKLGAQLTLSNIHDGAFTQKKLEAKSVNYFPKTAPSQILGRVLNTCLYDNLRAPQYVRLRE